MKIRQFDSARDAGQQQYHRMYKHAPNCIVLADLIASTATILEANRRTCTSFPMRIIATFDPTDGDRMLIIVEGNTTEQPRASEAESINFRRLRIVREIHGSEVCHTGY
jgi:hypothetical protein